MCYDNLMNNLFKKWNPRIRASTLLGLLLFSALFGAIPASACGCGLLVVSSDNGWSYGDDSVEQSFINFENGTEKLIISLNIKNRSHDAVLIIPIPAAPNSVKADVLSETPKFYGYNVSDRARKNLSIIRDVLLYTQLYPIVPLVLSSTSRNEIASSESNNLTLGGALDAAIDQGVTVYQHLEKEGMIAEVLSASNSDSLYGYLTQKGLKVEKDSIPIFRDYIHKDFSFVVSWISPSTSDVSAKGLLMTFPTEKIYYPLKPGSVYSGRGMQKTVTVVGYVSPTLYSSDIKNSTKVDYFYSSDDLSFKDFFSSDGGFGFTRIILNAEPQKYSQDLYISESAPIKILNAHLINLHPFVYGLILLIIISFVATYLSSRLILSSQLQTPTGIIGLGILNCFTILGSIVGSRIFLQEKRSKFVITFSLIFVAIVMLIWFLSSLLY